MIDYIECIRQFKLKLLDDERAENTIASYMSALDCFFKYYDEVNKENMIMYKTNMLKELKPATVKIRCIAMNKFCEFIGKPECKIKVTKTQKATKTENVPTLEEYNYLLSCLLKDKKYKYYWMIRFMASTGVRVSELVSLDKKCLRTGIMEMESKGKIRRIIIPKSLIEESKGYFKTVETELLFPNRYDEKMGTRGFAFALERMSEKYGLRREAMHPHAFRHFFAIQFLKNGGELTLLSDLLGHESLSTTAIYLQLSEAEQRQRLDDCLKW